MKNCCVRLHLYLVRVIVYELVQYRLLSFIWLGETYQLIQNDSIPLGKQIK
jgi:hypothetical protein